MKFTITLLTKERQRKLRKQLVRLFHEVSQGPPYSVHYSVEEAERGIDEYLSLDSTIMVGIFHKRKLVGVSTATSLLDTYPNQDNGFFEWAADNHIPPDTICCARHILIYENFRHMGAMPATTDVIKEEIWEQGYTWICATAVRFEDPEHAGRPDRYMRAIGHQRIGYPPIVTTWRKVNNPDETFTRLNDLYAQAKPRTMKPIASLEGLSLKKD